MRSYASEIRRVIRAYLAGGGSLARTSGLGSTQVLMLVEILKSHQGVSSVKIQAAA